MAKSKALSKETKSIISQKTSAAVKRVKQQTSTRSIAAGIGGVTGVGLAAVSDGLDYGIPVGDAGKKISLSVIGALVGIGGGLALGKSTIGGAAMGFGVGQLHGFLYDQVRDATVKMREG